MEQLQKSQALPKQLNSQVEKQLMMGMGNRGREWDGDGDDNEQFYEVNYYFVAVVATV